LKTKNNYKKQKTIMAKAEIL